MRQGIHLEIAQGDDHLSRDGRALTIRGTGGNWPVAVSQAKLLLTSYGEIALEIDGYFTPASATDDPLISFDLPRADSLKLCGGLRRYDMEARALLATGSVITLARGWATVTAGIL